MKLTNEYANEVPHYDDIPKSVLAAIAFSLAVQLTGEEDWSKAQQIIITEWDILHNARIVPQPVPTKLRSLIDRELYQLHDDSGAEVPA